MPTSKEVIRQLEADGWLPAKIEGSHHHFKHPVKPGKVTVPHPRKKPPPENIQKHSEAGGAYLAP
jgi:predicted RNA binding protein YcfA (HicA-like mRNA interferase family)